MQAIISKLEQSLRNSESWLTKVFFGFILIFIYFLHSLYSLWLLLFSPPQKSFALLYEQDDNGLWKKSYYNHLKYRHNVRFSSISFTLLLVTSIVAVQMIMGLLSPYNKVEITYAATYIVSNNNDSGAGSLRDAISTAAANGSPDVITFDNDYTITLASSLVVQDAAALTIDGTGHNIVVDGSALAVGNLLKVRSNDVTVNNVDFVNFANGTAVYILGAVSNFSLSNSDLSNNLSCGFAVDNGPASSLNTATFSYVTASNNTGTGCQAGLYFVNSHDVTIDHSTINNNLYGIYISQGISSNNSDFIVTNNDIYSNTQNGIKVGGSGHSFEDNNIYDNSVGVNFSVLGSDNSVIDNNIYSNDSDGVFLDSGISDTTVSDNHIYSNGSDGIGVRTSTGNIFSGNYIGTNEAFADLGNNSDGIALYTSANDNSVGNNYVYYNENGIRIFQDSTDNTLNNNSVFNNNTDGIKIDGAGSIRNKITQCLTQEILLDTGGNENLAAPVVSKCVASNTTLLISGAAAEATGTIEIFGSDIDHATETYLTDATISGTDINIEYTGDATSYLNTSLTFTDSDNNTSSIESCLITLDQTAPVSSASVPAGTYTTAQTVTLSVTDAEDPAPVIYYTLDGATPTIASSVYSTPLTISETTTLKFFAADMVHNNEDVHTVEYVIDTSDTNTNTNTNTNSNTNTNTNTNENANANINVNTNVNENINESFLSLFKINDINATEEKVRITDTTPDFQFSDVPESKIGSKIIIKIKQRQQDILTLTKKVNKFGRAIITVPDEEELDMGNYKVYTGVVGEDNLAFRTRLQIVDFPPNLDLIPTVITDENLPIASSAQSITASLWDNLGERATATSSSSTNGVFILNFDATPAAGYSYTLKTVASSNGVDSDEKTKTIFLTPNQYVETLVAIPNTEENKYRLTYVNPKVSGLAAEGKTPVIYLDTVEQGNAIIQEPCSGTCSWYYQLENVAVGVHRVAVAIDDSSYVMDFRKDLSAVTPKIVSHEDGGSYNKPPLLTIVGHATDKLYIYDQDLNLLKEAAFNDSGIYKFNTSPYVDYGLNVFKFRAQDDAKYSSYVTFGFNLRRPIITPEPLPAPEEPPVETNININVNTNQTINTNLNENFNVNTNINTNANANANINGNVNTNINVNKNININEPVLSTEEEQWLNVISEEVIQKYNNDGKSEPPGALPYLTTAKETMTAAQQQQLTVDLTNTITSSQQITARVNGERVTAIVSADGKLKFQFTKEYDLMSSIKRLLGLGDIILGEDSLVVEGQIPESQLKNLPAYAFVVVYSDPVIQIAQVDKDGRWTITIPLELLPPGEHTAYAQTEVNGTKSQQVELAKFAVEEKTKLSNTTWLVIINVGIAVLILVVAIIIQGIRNKKKRTEGGANEK